MRRSEILVLNVLLKRVMWVTLYEYCKKVACYEHYMTRRNLWQQTFGSVKGGKLPY